MISGAVAMEDGAKMASAFAALTCARIALKSDWFVWNCCSVAIAPPSVWNCFTKKFASPVD